ncbi:UNVERIFIED_CONTAM: hypothetical protein ABIE34_000608 [Jeotgalibacillus campisalis]
MLSRRLRKTCTARPQAGPSPGHSKSQNGLKREQQGLVYGYPAR